MVDNAFVASVVIGIKGKATREGWPFLLNGGLLISSISEKRVYAYFS